MDKNERILKYLNLCSEDGQRSYGVGMVRIFFAGTKPLKVMNSLLHSFNEDQIFECIMSSKSLFHNIFVDLVVKDKL